MRYVQAKQALYTDDMAYRIYVTDALKLIIGSDMRYVDLLDLATKPALPEQDASEIKDRIVGKLRAMGGD